MTTTQTQSGQMEAAQTEHAPPETPAPGAEPAGGAQDMAWNTREDVIGAVQAQVIRAASAGRAWLLIHADFGVGFGYADGQSVCAPPDMADLLDPEYLQELRLFGLQGEWHAWRHQERFRARLRVDKNPPDAKFIEEHQALWGTRAEAGPWEGWTTLREQRGPCLRVPHTLASVAPEKRLRLRLRHYLATDADTHLATFCDSRLVALCDADCKPLPWPITR